ncbi:hypothetical protein AAKU52_003226 [Pedobacter sp. CG_S7]|uniref:IS66 family insertion sequence element accessory protein TnpA n=1 Tax=Pedobacter sp. CG_S7 TaxID=3143930 RepID=UPI00339195A9
MTKAEKMFKLVALWGESGLSREVFSQQHKLRRGTFSYWIAKAKEAGSDENGGFIRLESPSFDSGYEITYPNGVKLL